MSHSDVIRPVSKQDLFDMRFLQGASLSPDGAYLVYAVTHYREEDDSDVTQLWLREMATGKAWPLTHGKHSNHSPAFAPNGQEIAFISTRDESETPQLYRLSLQGGEAVALTTLKQGVFGMPIWSNDGRKIAFTTRLERENPPDPNKPYRVDRTIYRFDVIGYLHEAVQELFVLDLDSGDVSQLTHENGLIMNARWSPNDKELLFGVAMKPDVKVGLFPILKVADLDGNCRTLVDGSWGDTRGSLCWLPNGQEILFTGVEKGMDIGTKADLYKISASGTGTPENRTAGLSYGVGGGLQGDQPAGILALLPAICPTSDGRSAFIRVQQGGEVQIYRVELTGPEAWAPVVTGARSNYLIDLSKDDRSLLYVSTTFNQPADLFSSDIEGENEEQLTALNREHLARVAQTRVKRMLFPGSDGVEVEGWTIMPAEGDGPFPTVLYIHGGPHGAFGHAYHFDTQMLVGAGYAVIMVNHRASTGYGDDFSTAIKGDWGNLDYHDLMAGVDYAIAQGWADPDRLGVCGLSGGGNLSCWIVGQTRRFKAAVPENPVTNWVSFYGVSDIGPWFAVEQLGGLPHEIPEVYAKCSPITYAHTCTTPTLLVQGEHDYRCPAEQSEQFYAVLRANECPVEMLRLPKGSHGDSIRGVPALRRAHNDALLDWMNRYVLDMAPDEGII